MSLEYGLEEMSDSVEIEKVDSYVLNLDLHLKHASDG